MNNTTRLLYDGLQAAIQAAQAKFCLPNYLPEPPSGRTVVIGMGKAGAAMAQAFEAHWTGSWDRVQSLVAVPYHSVLPTQHIHLVECAHPIPDTASENAAKQMLALVSDLTEQDLVVCLISGGGSALVSLAAPGLSLADKQALNNALIRSGASIQEINLVRRHLSAIKGGRLAAACAPARVVNLLISDVPGDDPTCIASGPTVMDPSTCAQALEVLAHYGIDLPPLAKSSLQNAAWESVKADHPIAKKIQTHLIATPHHALSAARQRFSQAGIPTLYLGDTIEGEAKEVAKVMAGMAQSCSRHAQPYTPPCILLSGGETSVTVKGQGQGGRNAEFLLALLIAVKDQFAITALAADTDGTDGALPLAGAFITPDTWPKALALGLDPLDYLHRNDAHTFFQRIDQSITTGPTHTNVNDFRAIFIE
ncbi:MAG TPA: glycerate kinase [Paenalcaligenes hominis]|uniref:Glycerate kinase n=1 Tax=Paenalcaligenes hominis TaxID=643674 RepID=A0A9D2VDS2_9BURK|nr:glycerate kinase [Paenalcaligenes hominis]